MVQNRNQSHRFGKRRWIRRVGAASVVGIVAGLMLSWVVAGRLVAPSQRRIGEPTADLHAVPIAIESESGATVSGWHCRPPNHQGVIVLLHGIRGNRLSMVPRARMLHDAGYATILVDLQAHGETLAESITLGHLEKHDVRAVVDYARAEHVGQPLGIIGVSLGGASTLLADPVPIDALVLESVYPSITDAIDNRVHVQLGPLAGIPSFLLKVQLPLRLGISVSDLRPIDKVSQLACPVLIASGKHDSHTTEAETRQMYQRASSPKELWLVEGAAHADLHGHDPEAYRQRVVGFLNRHLGE